MESCEEELVGLHRSSIRLVTPVQPDCVLVIGEQRLPAILADERDDGLHVLIQGSPLFWVEDSGVLQTSEAEIAVRVSNIVRIEQEKNDSNSNMLAFRIVLAHLGQTTGKLPPLVVQIPLQEPRPDLPRHPPRYQVRVTAGGIVAFAMIATPVVFVAAAWQHHVGSVVLQNDDTAPSDAVLSSQTVNPYSDVPEVAYEILQLPGVEPFLKPEVAKKLALTPSQVGAFGRLDKTTQVALEDLEKYWESAGRLELARRRCMLLETALQEALRLLTDQQRQQWESMTR